jgi:hypothetical protein
MRRMMIWRSLEAEAQDELVHQVAVQGVGRPLGMLMTAVSHHRRLRWQLCQLRRCLRKRTWRALGQPARMER